MALKPFRGNTLGPVEEFLREVYKWSLTIPGLIADAVADIDLSDIEADIVALDARVDTAETDIANLETDVAAHETRLDDAEADIADHETRIDALEADEAAFKTTTYSGGYIFSSTITVTSYAPANVHRPAAAPITAIAQAQLGIGRNGTLKNLRARVLTATADADTFTVGINVNGSTTALVTPTTQGTSTAWVANTGTNLAVSQGDLFCIEITPVSGQQSGFTLLWTYDFEDAG
jgi:flagellin-like hook-associated protein FlgL